MSKMKRNANTGDDKKVMGYGFEALFLNEKDTGQKKDQDERQEESQAED